MGSLSIIFILNGVFFISLFFMRNIFISLILTVFSLFILLLAPWPKKNVTADSTSSLLSINLKNTQYGITVVCLIIFVLLQNYIGFSAALFAAFFIFSYINHLDSRAGFFIGFALLALTALLAAGGDTGEAEHTATFAYYFLVITVIWHTIAFFKDKLAVVFLTCIVVFAVISGFILLGHKKKSDIEKGPELALSAPKATPTVKPLVPIPFRILNGTNINGLAASTAATLRKLDWGKEFDISIGNNETTASASILTYTDDLEMKKILFERDFHIRITPVIVHNASHEAEMILILGK